MLKSKLIPNMGLIICSAIFILLGILTIATASPPFSINEGLSPNYFLFHQLLYGFLPGFIMAFILFLFPLKGIKKMSFWIFAASYILMFLVFVPGIGITEGGASRWISIFGSSFQPSELLKLTTIIYLSALLSSEKTKKALISFLIVMGLVSLALILQSDMSTLVTIFIIAFTIYFCATKSKKRDFAIIAAIGGILFALMIFFAPYRMERIMTMFNPSENTSGAAYQINQTLISIGSGGIDGSGLGLSAQKFGFVPESMSDSIFAIYAEELGFLGCAFLVSMFFLLAFFSFSEAGKADGFGRLIAVGVGVWIPIQALINIAAMTNLIPLSGTPLPFLSYGGTHLIVEMMSLGLLLNVSRNIDR